MATSFETDTLTHLDFEPDLACEHSEHQRSRDHGGSAWALVEINCPHCPNHAQITFCRRWWDTCAGGFVTCVVCRAYVRCADIYTIVKVL